METLRLFLAIIVLSSEAFAQEKWVWGREREQKAGFARGDGKGRYAVFEPDAPDEVYRPGRPSANLPPLIRPSGRPPTNQFNNNNNGPYQFPPLDNNNFNNINNNPPPPFPPASNNFNINNNRYPPGPSISSYPGRPPLQRPYPSGNPDNVRPPLTIGGPPIGGPPIGRPPKGHAEHPDINDPTNFDKCKCVYSFNCKSPGILFGTCDTGKKYCCEKFVAPNPRGPDDDLRDPEVLAGPGGPVDPIFRNQGGNYRGTGGSYGRLPSRSSQ